MRNTACVGGILEDGRYVRILKSNEANLPINTKISVGDIYEISFIDRPITTPPHIEDILVSSAKLIEQIDITAAVIREWGGEIWSGGTDVLFDGCLRWTDSGSGYVVRSNGLPTNSVGFWLPNRNLGRNDYENKVKFRYPNTNWRTLPFVGFQDPVDMIASGTLVRLSLARWWSPDDTAQEERCYLQLSGWY